MTYGNLCDPYPEQLDHANERIRDLEARVDGLVRARAMHLERIAWLEAENARLQAGPPRHDPSDVPITRAEADAMALLAETVSGINNEERD